MTTIYRKFGSGACRLRVGVICGPQVLGQQNDVRLGLGRVRSLRKPVWKLSLFLPFAATCSAEITHIAAVRVKLNDTDSKRSTNPIEVYGKSGE